MKLSRVVLAVLLSAFSLLSVACGSDDQCQPATIGTDAGSMDQCPATGTTVQACCSVSHAIANTDRGQCKYVIDVPGSNARVFACDAVNCVTAAQAVRNFCGTP